MDKESTTFYLAQQSAPADLVVQGFNAAELDLGYEVAFPFLTEPEGGEE